MFFYRQYNYNNKFYLNNDTLYNDSYINNINKVVVKVETQNLLLDGTDDISANSQWLR